MSTTSTVITIIICVLLVAAIGIALVKGIWTVSKKITVPIQIALFVVMLGCIIRLFCTKENAQKLYKGVEETGIGQNVENTMRAALNLKPVEASKPEAKSAQVADAPATPAPVAPAPVAAPTADVAPNPAPKTETAQGQAIAKTDSQTVEAPAVVNVEVKVTPAQPPAVAPEPAPAKVVDYSHLDKGKKTFSYALPFNAKVTVGFKDNTYRVIAESLGRLDDSEKKEIGNLILSSLGKYVGKTITISDKSKVSIESRYDESDDRTRVFAIVPPDAID
jgi:hypothetical protein